jgi:hypothetical protein
LEKDVIERMPLSGVVLGETDKREYIFQKTGKSVKFFNTNPCLEMKSKGEFYDRN